MLEGVGGWGSGSDGGKYRVECEGGCGGGATSNDEAEQKGQYK
jgi:hypothetical protein